MEKYLIIQCQETETPTNCIASNGSFIKETVIAEMESPDITPSVALWQWLFLHQIEYSIFYTASGRFVNSEGNEVWQPGDSSADLPHLASTLVVSVFY